MSPPKVLLVAGVCGAMATGAIAQSKDEAAISTSLPDLNPGEGWIERTPVPPKGGSARAWSDPAAGCHLILMTTPASKRVGEAPMRSSLETTLAEAKLAIHDDDSGLLKLAGVDIDGLASLEIVQTPERSASLLVCYWNEREPTRCEAQCRSALQDRVAK